MHVAIVLPPRESYSPEAAGAVAMVARLHAEHGRLPAAVLGRAVAQPFAGFRPVTPGFWPGSANARYEAAVARLLRHDPPALVEVHNRPDLARALAERHRVTLLLHNDPRGMRGAVTPRLRADLAARVRVLAVSGWVANRFGSGAEVLHNAVDLVRLPPLAAVRDPLILFAGRMVADKGADIFVDACARALPRLAGWRAEMIGADRFGADSPDTPFLRRLRRRAAAAGVAMAGWRPHAQVMEAMARAAIVAVPSRWPEPFGLVALEAMASGAAVMFAPTGGLPEVVGDAGVPVASEQAEDWAAALVELARRHRPVGTAGMARAKLFDAAGMAARLDALRDSVLARPPPISGD